MDSIALSRATIRTITSTASYGGFARSFAALLLLTLAGLPVLADAPQASAAQSVAPNSAPSADPVALGRRIFREGRLPNGQPLRGVGQAGAVLSGTDAACATCHRRSGYGSSEGPIEVRAITGPALFGERVAPLAPGSPGSEPPSEPLLARSPEIPAPGQSAAEAARSKAQALRAARTAMFSGNRPRPTYDDALLARAIRTGVGVTGRGMDATMPRFAMDASALASLTAYLKTLSMTASPGVTADTVHFATVIQPGTNPAQRSALIDVLQTFIHDRNLSQRVEARREQAGQIRLGRIYREWVLHVWDLQGANTTWGAQLEALNRAQPVFALVSGLGEASWRPIHEFSERFEVPCILPQTLVPTLDGPNFYTVYLSQGMTLEAQALAKYLHDSAENGPVLQVYRSDDASATAAAAFRNAWRNAKHTLRERELNEAPTTALWQQLAQEAAGATLVLWLKPADLAAAQALTAKGAAIKAIYLSSGLQGGESAGSLANGSAALRIIYPQDPPRLREARLAVVKRWLQINHVAVGDEPVQFNAYLAATEVGMLVSHSKDTYSREFLIERMEHRLGTAIELSMYPHLSLGPGQRFASKGSYIAAVGGDGQVSLVSDWVVP